MSFTKEQMREYQRKRRMAQKVEVDAMVRDLDKLSDTDALFDADRPGWYIFDSDSKKRECWKCGAGFETRLGMNKFCSPKCKNEFLDSAGRKSSTLPAGEVSQFREAQ